MLVSILLCDMDMQSTLTALNTGGPGKFSDLAQRSLGLYVLQSEANRLVTHTDN